MLRKETILPDCLRIGKIKVLRDKTELEKTKKIDSSKILNKNF